MKIVWTEPARQDLREIFEYIAEENPRAARALLTEIKQRVIGDRPRIIFSLFFILGRTRLFKTWSVPYYFMLLNARV